MPAHMSNARAMATILPEAAWNYGRNDLVLVFPIFLHVGHSLRSKFTESEIRDMNSTLPLYGFPFYKFADGKIGN